MTQILRSTHVKVGHVLDYETPFLPTIFSMFPLYQYPKNVEECPSTFFASTQLERSKFPQNHVMKYYGIMMNPRVCVVTTVERYLDS